MGGWAGYGVRQAAGLAVPLGFLRFSRGMERQADRLGLEYMYKAGYDPTAFIDFFERIQTMEKRKPGTISKIFASQPPTDDRVRRAQKEIQEGLQPLREYVVDTSEFQRMKSRLARLESRRRVDQGDDNRPALKRRPSGTVDGGGEEQSGDDERPRLKRR
jgi:predicted Zn-dependent protease